METKEKRDALDWRENFKTGFKSTVDLIILLIIVGLTVVDILIFKDILDWDIHFGYALIAFIYLFVIFRIGYDKNALNEFVEDERARNLLKLPPKKKENN